MKAAAVVFADVVDGADIGMIEGGGGFGFALEAFEGLRVASEIVGEEFESDGAIEARVLRLCKRHPCRRHRVFR